MSCALLGFSLVYCTAAIRPAVIATPRDSLANTFRSTHRSMDTSRSNFDVQEELSKRSIKQLLTPARQLVNLKRRMPTHEVELRREAEKARIQIVPLLLLASRHILRCVW